MRENEQLGASLQGHLWHKAGDGWAVCWGLEAAQPQFSKIETSETGLPKHANNQAVSDQQQSVTTC